MVLAYYYSASGFLNFVFFFPFVLLDFLITAHQHCCVYTTEMLQWIILILRTLSLLLRRQPHKYLCNLKRITETEKMCTLPWEKVTYLDNERKKNKLVQYCSNWILFIYWEKQTQVDAILTWFIHSLQAQTSCPRTLWHADWRSSGSNHQPSSWWMTFSNSWTKALSLG